MNFIQSIFWDSKSGTYSASRIVMIGSFFITFCVAFIVVWITYTAYFVKGTTPPDLSWLMYGGGGTGLTGIGAYGMNRWGTSDNPVLDNEDNEPDFSTIQPSEDEN